MTTDEEAEALDEASTFFWLLGTLVVVFFVIFILWVVSEKVAGSRFEAVCKWEGGTVHGDLCTKGTKVLITKNQVLTKLQ